jgi:hypothetical protein
MNPTPTHADAPEDLDRMFAEFFKAQLKHPWPNAPVPGATSAAKSAEPSELVAARATEMTEPAPTAAPRDNTARARLTLAASVALMLGTCWYLSNGYQPGSRPVQGTPTPPVPGSGVFNGSGANDQGVLPEVKKIKAEERGGPKIDMGKFE